MLDSDFLKIYIRNVINFKFENFFFKIGVMWAIWGSAKKVLKYNIYLKNSFARLSDTIPVIFGYKNFFGSGLFLTFFWIWWIEKMPRAKKVVNEKNAFLHARQLRDEIFDVCSNGYCIFTIEVFFQNGRHQSNFENWCLKMKSRGLYHIYILWKSWLLLDFRKPDPL